jgi:putative transcriptional regulator|tara:strand:+ start:545 stop:1180 length:636 start_codon:yes stop_codon:yes gene_type:complete
MKKLLWILLIGLFFNFSVFAKVQDSPRNYLKGKFYNSVKDYFLIATEKMQGSRFSETVIVMLENNENGAWGLVINKPLGTMPIALLIDTSLITLEEKNEILKTNIPVFWGGPVDVEKIFILHTAEYQGETTKNYGEISVSQDYNILFDIAINKGPKKSLIIFGYSGWGSGQLEGEMERASWVLSEISQDLIFKMDDDKKWLNAIDNSFIRL